MLRKLKVLLFIVLSISIFGFTPKNKKFCSTLPIIRNYSNVTITRIEIWNTDVSSSYRDFSVSVPPGGSFTGPAGAIGNYIVILTTSAPVTGSYRVIWNSGNKTIACGRVSNSTNLQINAYLTGCSYFYFDLANVNYC